MKHNLGDLKDLKEIKKLGPGPSKVPALNLTTGLKPISETYGGDESEEEEKPEIPSLNFGMPAAMSKTFDMSQKVVPKLDFMKLKHVKE